MRTDQLKVFFSLRRTKKKKKKRERRGGKKKRKRKGCFPGAAADGTDPVRTGSRKLFAGAPLPSNSLQIGVILEV